MSMFQPILTCTSLSYFPLHFSIESVFVFLGLLSSTHVANHKSIWDLDLPVDLQFSSIQNVPWSNEQIIESFWKRASFIIIVYMIACIDLNIFQFIFIYYIFSIQSSDNLERLRKKKQIKKLLWKFVNFLQTFVSFHLCLVIIHDATNWKTDHSMIYTIVHCTLYILRNRLEFKTSRMLFAVC